MTYGKNKLNPEQDVIFGSEQWNKKSENGEIDWAWK